jgi:hypothetical protein
MSASVANKGKGGIMSCVRFSDIEYQVIDADRISTGKSIPTLLKEKYFSGERPRPLFSKADHDAFSGEMGRIGNNLNQIARRVNSGIREGFVEELTTIQRSLDHIWLFLTSKYCRCKRG